MLFGGCGAQLRDMKHLGALRQRFSVDGRAFTTTSRHDRQNAATPAAADGRRRPSIRPTLLPKPSGSGGAGEEREDGKEDEVEDIYFTFAPGVAHQAAARRKSETDVVDKDNENA